MYKIIVRRYDRTYNEVQHVEHTFETKVQAERLFDGKHKLKSRDDISRRIVYDDLGDPKSLRGVVIEQVNY